MFIIFTLFMPSMHSTRTQPSTWGESQGYTSRLIADRQGTASRKDWGRCSKGSERGTARAGGRFRWCWGTAINRTGARCWDNTTQSTWDATPKRSMKAVSTSSVLQPRCILDDTFVYRHILFFLFLSQIAMLWMLCLVRSLYSCQTSVSELLLRLYCRPPLRPITVSAILSSFHVAFTVAVLLRATESSV